MVAFTRRGKDIQAVEQQYEVLLRSEGYYPDTTRFHLSIYRFVESFRATYDNVRKSLIDLNKKGDSESFNKFIIRLFENIKTTLIGYTGHKNEKDSAILGEVFGKLIAGIDYGITSDMIDPFTLLELESLYDVIMRLKEYHPSTDFSIIKTRVLQIGEKKQRQVRKGKAQDHGNFVGIASYFDR